MFDEYERYAALREAEKLAQLNAGGTPLVRKHLAQRPADAAAAAAAAVMSE